MRVLVTAASKYGATAGIAEAIGRRLDEEQFDVDVVPVEEVDELGRFAEWADGIAEELR